jgi:cell division protein FtsN
LGIALALGVLVSACVGPYAERPPAEGESPRPAADIGRRDEPEADRPSSWAEEGTLVGYVTPDGDFHTDSVPADSGRIDRRTVVTGTVRRASPVADPSTAGYRVQVFAAQDRATAEAVAARLEGRLNGQPVYVERQDPWYKVRVGDFATREEADRLRKRLVEMGYPEAWTTRATIRPSR